MSRPSWPNQKCQRRWNFFDDDEADATADNCPMQIRAHISIRQRAWKRPRNALCKTSIMCICHNARLKFMDQPIDAPQLAEKSVAVAQQQSDTPLSVSDTFPVSPYAVPASDAFAKAQPNSAVQTKAKPSTALAASANQHLSPKSSPAKEQRVIHRPKSAQDDSKVSSIKSPAKDPKVVPRPKSAHDDSKVSVMRAATSAHSVPLSARPQSFVHPTEEFKQEEAKILTIVDSQQSVTAAYVELSAFSSPSNDCVGLRELSAWLPIKFSTLNNKVAIRLALKNAKKLQYLQDSKATSKELLWIKLRPPPKDDRKVVLELEDIPSFLENLIAYHRIAKLVSRIDPSGELKLSKLEIFLFLKAISVSFDCQIGKGLAKKVEKGSVSFSELCRISFDLDFTSLDIRDKNNALSQSWNFTIEKPRAKEVPLRKIKSHDEVSSQMQFKIRNQTRSQDAMASTTLPYMIKSRLRQKKHQLYDHSPQAESSSSSIASGISSFGRIGSTSSFSTRPNSASKATGLWKQGNTPREPSHIPSSYAALVTPSSLFSRTQRSFEQGSVLDSRRQRPLFVDTENGQTVYDIPLLSCSERMNSLPYAEEGFKLIEERPGLNPFAFSTSRTPRLYGLHTSKPVTTRRAFAPVPQLGMFFHNADINTRKQYRPCTAGSLQSSRKCDQENKLKPKNWCSGGVPWNGKSTELPKYSGDIGFFEANQFKKRFETDMGNRHLWTVPNMT